MAHTAPKEIGSTAETNRLLEESSKQTGIEAPVFNEETGAKVDGTVFAPNIEGAASFNIPEAPEPDIANKFIADTPVPPEAPEQPVADPSVQAGAEDIRTQLSERQSILEELGLGDIKDTFEDLLGKGAFTQRTEDVAGIDDKTTSLNEIVSQLRETDLKFKRERERIQAEPGLTKAQTNARLADVSRKQATELADLSVIQATRRDDLSTAQALVDRKVELKFEPLEQKLQFQQFLFNENKELFTKVESRQFEAKLRKEQVQIDKDKFKFQQTEQLKLNFMMNAAEAGQSNAYLQSIQGAETTEDLLAIPGIQGFSTSASQRLSNSLNTAKLDALSNPSEAASEFSSVVNTASLLVGVKRGEASKKAMNQALKDGDFKTTYALIANNIEEGLTGENATKFGAQRNDYVALTGMRAAIVEYTDGGGDIGLLSGKAEDISRKLLGVTTNPELTALAVQLEREFQAYRTAATGAAFSPEESRDYAKVNPRSTASLELNLATIDGARNQLANRINSTVNVRVPGAQDIWDIANGVSQEDYIAETLNTLGSETDFISSYLTELGVPIN